MAGGATGMYFLRSGVSWGIPGGGEVSNYQVVKLANLKNAALGV